MDRAPPDYFFRLPDRSNWEARVAGIHYVPPKGEEPNAFHRFAQRLAFGVRWRKLR